MKCFICSGKLTKKESSEGDVCDKCYKENYFTDAERKQKWECAYCGSTHRHSIRPKRCSCRNGYVKHIKLKDAKTGEGEQK